MKWQRLSCETRSHVKSIPDLKRTVRFIHIYTVCPPCHEIWSQNPLVSAHHASFHLRLAFYKWMPAPFPALHSRAKLRSDWYLKLYLFFTLYISLLFGQFENRSASAVESLFQKQSANKSSWPSSFQQFFLYNCFRCCLFLLRTHLTPWQQLPSYKEEWDRSIVSLDSNPD